MSSVSARRRSSRPRTPGLSVSRGSGWNSGTRSYARPCITPRRRPSGGGGARRPPPPPHRALADSLARDDDHPLRAWHLAAGALGPDEEIAAALEAVADRARGRNAHPEAAVALEKAARLTPDPAARVRRFAQPAEAAWVVTDSGRTLGLIEAAEDGPAGPSDRARLLALRGVIERRVGLQSTARDLLLEAAALTAKESPREAANILVSATSVTFFAGDLAAAVELARRLRDLAPTDGTELDGRADATLGWILFVSGHADEGRPVLERAVDVLLAAEQLGDADQHASISIRLAKIDAARGEDPRCCGRIDECVRRADEHGALTMTAGAKGVLGLLELGVGRYTDAIEQLERVCGEVEGLGLHDRDNSPHPDLVEALVRAGRREAAAEVLDRYAERAREGTPLWGGALVARCRGMLADDDEQADAHFTEALALHGQVEDRFQHARTLLVLGERLRRTRRRRDARSRLREALGHFEELGATPWAERARTELRATGETLRRRESFDGEQLA